jgi:hypothetical protein
MANAYGNAAPNMAVVVVDDEPVAVQVFQMLFMLGVLLGLAALRGVF